MNACMVYRERDGVSEGKASKGRKNKNRNRGEQEERERERERTRDTDNLEVVGFYCVGLNPPQK